MTIEFVHGVLSQCNIALPSLRAFKTVMQDADKETEKEAIKKLGEMPTAGYLSRRLDRQLAAQNRTVIVSLSADAFENEFSAPLGHLHVLGHIDNQVLKFKWWRHSGGTVPAVAITFQTTRDRDAAVTIMEGWYGDEAWPQVETSTYEAARNKNTIWSIGLRTTTEQKLQGLISALLPTQSYRPTYQLEEYGVAVYGGARVQVEGSQPWLDSAIPPPMTGYEWRLTAMDEAECIPCLQGVARAPRVSPFTPSPQFERVITNHC